MKKWVTWKVTYDDGTSDEFYDISLELLGSYIDGDKTIVLIERYVCECEEDKNE